jgi:hypothetical protein
LTACTKCDTELKPNLYNRPQMTPCPSCGTPLRVLVFPALYREIETGAAGESLLTDDDAGCFYHPGKKAVVPCSACGRFLCGLCDIEFDGDHICPSCLEAGKKKRNISKLENQRTLYDSMALILAVYPMLIFYFTFITAPVVLFITIRYWNAPNTIVGRVKWRFVLAFIIALAQLGGWGMFIYALAT